MTLIKSTTGVIRTLHSRDPRPPHEVQFALERDLMVLFVVNQGSEKHSRVARGNVNGAQYVFEFRFEAALRTENCYSLRVEGSWGEHSPENRDYFATTSESWFNLWTPS